jgi:hypothetical protein
MKMLFHIQMNPCTIGGSGIEYINSELYRPRAERQLHKHSTLQVLVSFVSSTGLSRLTPPSEKQLQFAEQAL